jgi:hypothetical protein
MAGLQGPTPESGILSGAEAFRVRFVLGDPARDLLAGEVSRFRKASALSDFGGRPAGRTATDVGPSDDPAWRGGLVDA